MAQPMRCDWPDHGDVLADVLLSRLDDGSTMAWCGLHFVEACRSIVVEADLAAAGVPPAATGDPIIDAAGQALAEAVDDDRAEARAAARIEAVAVPPMSPESSDAGAQHPEPPTNGAGGPAGAELDPDASPDADGALGPNLTGTEDATASAEPV